MLTIETRLAIFEGARNSIVSNHPIKKGPHHEHA